MEKYNLQNSVTYIFSLGEGDDETQDDLNEVSVVGATCSTKHKFQLNFHVCVTMHRNFSPSDGLQCSIHSFHLD